MGPLDAIHGAEPASLEIVDPSGHRSRAALDPLPFRIGRSPESHLVLRDSRVSRAHAVIVYEGGEYCVEDGGSTHGTYVNGERVGRRALRDGDRIGFGADDSYSLVFSLNALQLRRLLEQAAGAHPEQPGLAPAGLSKLRAILEMARAVESSLSIDDVLAALVDAAMAVTGSERGFLLLRKNADLEVRVARGSGGRRLEEGDLRVPREVLRRALERRRDLLSVTYDALGEGAQDAGQTALELDLRSAVCVPLVRIRAGQNDVTSVLSAGAETTGAIYLDSRGAAANLADGGRELLQTLAIEASTVLENARLLEEERAKLRMEEELSLARSIQRSLLPSALPSEGWLRASAIACPSRMVGGDYYDLVELHAGCWSAVVADVSGKGVGAALLASLLQGAFIAAIDSMRPLGHRMERMNRFLLRRTGGEKYATAFYCLLEESGLVRYVNAAQCPPILIHPDGSTSMMDATGPPVGLMEDATFAMAEAHLASGDKLLCYTDGVTEAGNDAGEFFGKTRLRRLAAAHAAESCDAIRLAIQAELDAFTAGVPQADDITLLILEFAGVS